MGAHLHQVALDSCKTIYCWLPKWMSWTSIEKDSDWRLILHRFLVEIRTKSDQTKHEWTLHVFVWTLVGKSFLHFCTPPPHSRMTIAPSQMIKIWRFQNSRISDCISVGFIAFDQICHFRFLQKNRLRCELNHLKEDSWMGALSNYSSLRPVSEYSLCCLWARQLSQVQNVRGETKI